MLIEQLQGKLIQIRKDHDINQSYTIASERENGRCMVLNEYMIQEQGTTCVVREHNCY